MYSREAGLYRENYWILDGKDAEWGEYIQARFFEPDNLEDKWRKYKRGAAEWVVIEDPLVYVYR